MLDSYQNLSLSVLVPLFNESRSVAEVVAGLRRELSALAGLTWEIIVINDGSTDNSAEILKSLIGVKVIEHPYNKGYGAALKTGIAASQYDWVMFFDADGQHRAAQIKDFLAYVDQYDLVVGDRSGGKYVRPTLRKPGLWLLRHLVNYLTDYKLPDINCGLRLYRKAVLIGYLDLLPNGFSISTTANVAFLRDKKNVKFLPIEVDPRPADTKSTVKPRHAFTVLLLIFRLIMVFSPLRIFFPVSFALFLLGLVFLAQNIIAVNISDGTVFVFVSSLIVFFFGLLADQMAVVRREIGKLK